MSTGIRIVLSQIYYHHISVESIHINTAQKSSISTIIKEKFSYFKCIGKEEEIAAIKGKKKKQGDNTVVKEKKEGNTVGENARVLNCGK